MAAMRSNVKNAFEAGAKVGFLHGKAAIERKGRMN
jgi:hypothetical protein